MGRWKGGGLRLRCSQNEEISILKRPIFVKAMKKRSHSTYSENHFLGTEETIFNFVYSKADTATKYPSGGV